MNEHARADGVRELVLLKQGQRYVFTCAPARRPPCSAACARWRDTDNNLNWYDAALLADQVGVRLGQRLQEHNPHA